MLLEKIAIITADYNGKIFKDDMSLENKLWLQMNRWLSAHPNADWFIISNGLTQVKWKRLRVKATRIKQIRSLWAAASNLSELFVDSIQALLPDLREYDLIVKLDSAEHSPEKIDVLCKAALAGDIAIGDLRFQHGQLSVCEELGREIFSTALKQIQFPLRFSNTHGMQAWKAAVFARVLPIAISWWLNLHSKKDAFLSWGIDLSLILTAYKLGVKITVLPFSGQHDRKRDPQKIYEQTMAYKIILENFRIRS